MQVPVGCICDNASAPLAVASGGPALELELVAVTLAPGEDHRHIHFQGEWARAHSAPNCAGRRRLPPPGHRVHLVYPYRYVSLLIRIYLFIYIRVSISIKYLSFFF